MPLCIRTSFLSRTVRIQSNLHAVGSLLSVLSIRQAVLETQSHKWTLSSVAWDLAALRQSCGGAR
jgi:hypothetical protein